MLSTITICEHHIVPSLIGRNSVVLDLGANNGKFALEILSRFACSVYSVEAVPSLTQAIGFKDRWHVYNYAITSYDGTAEINISQNPEASSIRAINNVCRRITVPSIRLETLIEKYSIVPDTLKVDIEGSEIELFESLSVSTISKFKQITVEFHDFIDDWGLIKKSKKIIYKIVDCGFYCIRFSRRNNFDVLFINRNCIDPISCFAIKMIDRDLVGAIHFIRRACKNFSSKKL